MANHHDANFKQLMSHRSFFEGFINAYFPKDLLNQMDWKSIELYKMGGKHLEEKTHKEFEADLIYLARFNQEESFLWIHCEHQSSPDKNMTLRIVNYQTAELLSYAKQNPKKNLPSIVTFIYHQGDKPWPYSLDIKDLFKNPDLAMKYFGQPILIDLPALSDEVLRSRENIGPIEMVLKHIRQKGFAKKIHLILAELRSVDDKCRKTLLKYIIQFLDLPKDELIQVIEENLPNDKEQAVTVYEQLIQEGMQRGVQQGMQRGVQQGMQQGVEIERLEIACSMLIEGFETSIIQKITKLSVQEITDLKLRLLN